MPGPGSYHYSDRSVKGIALGTKLKRKDETVGPGPGAYNCREQAKKDAGFSIKPKLNPEELIRKRLSVAVGPGDYQNILHENHNKSFKIGTSQRKSLY
jgi:hypothetical protein